MKKNALITSLVILPFLVGCVGERNGYPFEKAEKELDFYTEYKNEVEHDRFLKQYSDWLTDVTNKNRDRYNHFSSYALTQEYGYRTGEKEEWLIKETESKKKCLINQIDQRFVVEFDAKLHTETNLNGVTGKNISIDSKYRYGEVFHDEKQTGYITSDPKNEWKTTYISGTPYEDLKHTFMNGYCSEINPYAYTSLSSELSYYDDAKTYIDGTHLTYDLEEASEEPTEKQSYTMTGYALLRGQFDIYDDKYHFQYIYDISIKIEVTEDMVYEVLPMTINGNKFYAKKGDKIEQRYLVIKDIILELDNSLSVDKMDISNYKEVSD